MRAKACRRCRDKKLKCNETRPCDLCKLSGSECRPQRDLTRLRKVAAITPRVEYSSIPVLQEINAIDLSHKILGYDAASRYSSSAIPGGHNEGLARPQSDWRLFFPYPIPSDDVLNTIIDQYFTLVNWFMLVIDEASFRRRTAAILKDKHVDETDFNFCILMSTVWALGAHYLGRSTYTLVERSTLDALCQSSFQYLQQCFLTVISRPGIEVVQIGILYGSYNLFNGVPNLGFGVLGSTVKIAQVIDLHRENAMSESIRYKGEISRRVWWALEIFDKYAAIAFGRPATIDDSDCNVETIDDSQDPVADGSSHTTFVTYHKHKIRLYRTMGQFLSRRKQSHPPTSLSETRRRLIDAYSEIPDSLKCKADPEEQDNRLLMLQMQAIALTLTYDNLQLVLHRHLLFTAQRDHLSHEENEAILTQLFQSALSTANLARHPVTQSIYATTHAAMHLGMCALSAGIVLCAVVLDRPDFAGRDEALSGIQQITNLFAERLVGRSYRLAEQAVTILNALSDKINSVLERKTSLLLKPPSTVSTGRRRSRRIETSPAEMNGANPSDPRAVIANDFHNINLPEIDLDLTDADASQVCFNMDIETHA